MGEIEQMISMPPFKKVHRELFLPPMIHPALGFIAGLCGSSLSLAALAGLLPQVTTFAHCFTLVYFYSTSTSLHISCS